MDIRVNRVACDDRLGEVMGALGLNGCQVVNDDSAKMGVFSCYVAMLVGVAVGG